jgi:hypothetical protein
MNFNFVIKFPDIFSKSLLVIKVFNLLNIIAIEDFLETNSDLWSMFFKTLITK